MAETIDSLLVSLGLETDAKSFQKANDAIKGVKDGVLQLAAATGVGFGLKALTSDLVKSTLEMDRLSRITGFTLKQIDSLRYAMRRSGLNPESANKLAQQIPAWRQAAAQRELGNKAYWNGTFNPTEMADKSKSDQQILEYVIKSYGGMDNDQRRTLRSGLGLGENDDVTRLFEGGISGLRTAAAEFEEFYKPIDPALIDSANKFNSEMADLATNFENLSRSMGGKLLPIVNSLLSAINDFIKENPGVSEAILTAAGLGGTAAALKLAGRFVPGGAPSSAGGGSLMLNPWTIGIAAAVTPGNAFVSESEAKAMSNPGALKRENWAINNPGTPYKDDSSPQAILERNLPKNPSADEGELFTRLERERGLPSGLLNSTYQKESGGGKYLLSPKGAMGPFQFMPDTANDMGLKGNDVYDLEKSATAAANYYRQLLDRYDGDVPKAIAAYNHGMGNIDKKGLSNLPKETRDYIPGVLSGMDGGEDLLADYNYRRNQPPAMPGGTGVSGSMAMTQNNNVTINAPGADAGEIENRLATAFTDYSRQARDMMETEHY